MSALSIQNEAKEHITILAELLRDVRLEDRMLTLIKTEELMQGPVVTPDQLESIRVDLELELTNIRNMIFKVEQAQYITNFSLE